MASKQKKKRRYFDMHEGLHFRPEFIEEWKRREKEPLIPIDGLDAWLGNTSECVSLCTTGKTILLKYTTTWTMCCFVKRVDEIDGAGILN